jgi:hypothetical protein
MLKEEGIEYDAEESLYYDPSGKVIELDIQRIVTDYIEHMRDYQHQLKKNEIVHTECYNQPLSYDGASNAATDVNYQRKRPKTSKATTVQ